MTEPRSDASGVTRLRAGSADFELPLDAISAQPFWLNAAVNGLRRARPEFSAAEPMAPWLKWLLMAAVLLVPIVIATAPQAALDGALAAFAVPFFCMTLVRLYALWSFVRTRDLAPKDWAPDVSPGPRRARGWRRTALLQHSRCALSRSKCCTGPGSRNGGAPVSAR